MIIVSFVCSIITFVVLIYGNLSSRLVTQIDRKHLYVLMLSISPASLELKLMPVNVKSPDFTGRLSYLRGQN